MPILAQDWYEPNPDYSSFYQGDVVRDVPVIFLPDRISQWFVLRPHPRSTKWVDDVLKGEICKWFEAFPEGNVADRWTHGDKEEFVAAKAKMMTVVIATQSCDIVQSNYNQVAPVYPESNAKENSREHLRENNIQHA